MATYDLGDGVPLEHTVRDADGAPTAATVALALTRPAGTSFTPPSITNPSTGIYRAVPVPDAVGAWAGVWTTSGAIVSVTPFTFTVADPAPPVYTDLDTVKSMLGKVTSDDRDDLITSAIVSAARMIDRRCGRRFYADRAASARVFRPAGRVACDGPDEILRVDDFATTTGLIVETSYGIGGTWTAVASFEAGPDNAAAYGRPYTQIRGPLGWLTGCGKARLTVPWGWPTWPDEISAANALQASRLYRRKDSPQGVIASADWGSVRVSRVDPDVEALIAPFVIPLVA